MVQMISDEKILSYIKKVTNAAINDICLEFKISESTAKRALARLEKSGYIRRYKGGAVSLLADNTKFNSRLDSNREQKDMIARRAAENIKENSVVILLGGTTVSLMCPYLCAMKLTVITNSLPVLEQLKGIPGVTLIMLGGVYNHEEHEFFGSVTSVGLRLMHADGLFMSCVGFSPGVGFMTDHIDSVDFYHLCMGNADKTYMLADSSKSGRSSIAIIASPEKVDCVITDSGINEAKAAELSEKGAEVIIT